MRTALTYSMIIAGVLGLTACIASKEMKEDATHLQDTGTQRDWTA